MFGGSRIACLAYGESTGVFLSPMGSRHAFHVSDRAKLYGVLSLAMVLGACERDRVSPVYDAAGTIRRLDYDTNRDGQIDMRAYLENGRTVRIEADGDGDGVVERWEYYAPDGQID